MAFQLRLKFAFSLFKDVERITSIALNKIGLQLQWANTFQLMPGMGTVQSS